MIERDMFIGKVLDEDLLSKIYRNAYNAAWGDLEIKYQGRIDQMEEEHEAYKADIDKQMADRQKVRNKTRWLIYLLKKLKKN